MTAQLISNNEDLYKKWTGANPHGFVLNIRIGNNLTYRTIHRASCRSITTYQADKPEGAFTCRTYRKVVALTVQEIVAWAANNHGIQIKPCLICNPPMAEQVTLDDIANELEFKVKKSSSDPSGRRERLAMATTVKPEQVQVMVTMYRRNPDVIAEVLDRANGKCEICGESALFLRKRDNSPYLEVHHREWLADGGDDSVANAVAVCPNCHRRIHYG